MSSCQGPTESDDSVLDIDAKGSGHGVRMPILAGNSCIWFVVCLILSICVIFCYDFEGLWCCCFFVIFMVGLSWFCFCCNFNLHGLAKGAKRLEFGSFLFGLVVKLVSRGSR